MQKKPDLKTNLPTQKTNPFIFRPQGANQPGSVAKQTDSIDPARPHSRRSDGVGVRDAVKLVHRLPRGGQERAAGDGGKQPV
jgi:hypothetical protein